MPNPLTTQPADPQRPAWKRWSVIGPTLLGVTGVLETNGILPPGLVAQLLGQAQEGASGITAAIEGASALLGFFGLYRAANTAATRAADAEALLATAVAALPKSRQK